MHSVVQRISNLLPKPATVTTAPDSLGLENVEQEAPEIPQEAVGRRNSMRFLSLLFQHSG